MHKLLVSIIVPVYNVEKYIERCVLSLVNQTYNNLQIILVDDGSHDSCPKICDDFANKDSRISVIHKKNGGLSDARNAGISKAIGDYLLFVDSDDYLEVNAVEMFLNTLDVVNEKVDIVVGDIREISIDGGISYQTHTNILKNTIYSAKEYVKKSIKCKQFFVPACVNLYRTDFFRINNFKFFNDIYFEDLDLIPRIFLKADKVCYTNYAFYNYEKRENSITTGGNLMKKQFSAEIVLNHLFSIVLDEEDKKLKKILCRWISNIYLVMVGNLELKNTFYPVGMNYIFLLKNFFDFKDLCKTLVMGISRKIYINIYKKVCL